MNANQPIRYKSPSSSGCLRELEDGFLAADNSWWTGRVPLSLRMVAEVPVALYLNFRADKSAAAHLAPGRFRPFGLPGEGNATLFTILLFRLELARPLWGPRLMGRFTPQVMQSNWRFYGEILEPDATSRPGVLFVRTITTSLLLSAFGRRIARCFPLRRARRMTLGWASGRVVATIDPGLGSAPELLFEGEAVESPHIGDAFREQFPSYRDYTRWIIDQHLSLVIWPHEAVVQDMHLDFQRSRIIPLRTLQCRIPNLGEFVLGGSQPFDCFLVEGLTVFLDRIYSTRT